MNRRLTLLLVVVLAVLSTGCFIETGDAPNLSFDGDIEIQEGNFSMRGDVAISGQNMENRYENVTLELYDVNGTLLYSERLGTVRNGSERLPVLVRLDRVPEYIVLALLKPLLTNTTGE